MKSFIIAYAGFGAIGALWFVARMMRWAWVGQQRGAWGYARMAALVPFAALLWPFTFWVLFSDRRGR